MEDRQERARRLYDAIREILSSEWDPIGVDENLNLRDEYDSYAEAIYRLIVGGAPTDRVADHLGWIQADQIGIPADRTHDEAIAGRLIGLVEADRP